MFVFLGRLKDAVQEDFSLGRTKKKGVGPVGIVATRPVESNQSIHTKKAVFDLYSLFIEPINSTLISELLYYLLYDRMLNKQDTDGYVQVCAAQAEYTGKR